MIQYEEKRAEQYVLQDYEKNEHFITKQFTFPAEFFLNQLS